MTSRVIIKKTRIVRTSADKKPCEPQEMNFCAWSVLYLLLTILFSVLVACLASQHIFHARLVPLFNKLNWDPENAFPTYYDSICTVDDITTNSTQDLFIRKANATRKNSREAVDKVLHHGMAIFDSILDKTDAAQLRRYVLKKNMRLTKDEAFVVQKQEYRYSFALHHSEHPSIAPILNQIASHPVLRDTLENLLGLDPALVELSTITSVHGAEHQSWHSDTSTDGSHAWYGQSIAPLYSLLIPLQDTTAQMGATSTCPGTHMCLNMIPECDTDHGIQSVASGEENSIVFAAGDGLLYISSLRHRGAAHRGGPDRVVMILSFVPRPSSHLLLPEGATYAMRWDMWGHTLQDMLDTSSRMSIWKSLGVGGRGWDFVTTSCWRMVNRQYYLRPYDLGAMLHYRSGFLGKLPSFLRGRVDFSHGNPWSQFLLGTLRRFVYFSSILNFVAVFLFVKFVSHHANVLGKKNMIINSLMRMVMLYVVVAGVGLWFLKISADTTWAKFEHSAVKSGRNSAGSRSVPADNFRIPNRNDVLFWRHLYRPCAQRHFLEYHPGNREWNCFAKKMYRTSLNDSIWSGNSTPWRFLQQTEDGLWVIMTREEVQHEAKSWFPWDATTSKSRENSLDGRLCPSTTQRMKIPSRGEPVRRGTRKGNVEPPISTLSRMSTKANFFGSCIEFIFGDKVEARVPGTNKWERGEVLRVGHTHIRIRFILEGEEKDVDRELVRRPIGNVQRVWVPRSLQKSLGSVSDRTSSCHSK